jgi:hypothetical protein
MKATKTKLGYKERDALFQKYYTEFKIKVALNWFELIALLAVSFFVSYKVLKYVGMEKITTCLIMAIAASAGITIVFSYIRKYKLSINRFDKERIYKRVSSELFEENKES